MKTKVLSAIAALVFSGAAFAQTTGGPDAYGYVWRNNADAQGPTVAFNSIKGIGTQVSGLGDDNSVVNVQMNWPFHFYWNDYNKITFGSNGWIGFQGAPANIAAPFPTLPATTAKNTICPLLSDLTFTQTNSSPVPGCSAWYWSNNVDSFIVQYDSVPYWVNNASGYAGRYTFQVILSGADSSITFQYQSCVAGTPAYTTSEGTATGISNSTGLIGLQVLPSLTFPTSNTAVKFYYPNPVTYTVIDVAPAWNDNSANGGFFVGGPYGNPVTLSTDIANVGNTGIGSSINATGTLYDATLSQVWTSNVSVNGLAAGDDSIKAYPTTYAANTMGTYIFRSTTTYASDINSGNNVIDAEMVVVDTTQATVGLSYVTATTSTTANAWGGNGGQGVYFEPPFYPATVTSMEFFVLQTNAANPNQYELTQIYDDDGANGTAGTVLYNDSIAASAAVATAWNMKTLTTPLVVTSGGIYVAWMEHGDSLSAIGTDPGLPLSNRNYEIIGGNWAEFRNNSAEDLMIKVNIMGTSTTGTNSLENAFAVAQNYPNPSSSYTMVNFTLPSSADVQFSVRNMIGQDIDAINLGNQSAGTHTLKVNTSKLTSGIYFYTVKVGDKEITKKMVVSR